MDRRKILCNHDGLIEVRPLGYDRADLAHLARCVADAREAREGKRVLRVFNTPLWRSSLKLDTDGMVQPVWPQWANWDSGPKRTLEWGSALQCRFPMLAFHACRSDVAWACPYIRHCEPSGTARQPSRQIYDQHWQVVGGFLLRPAVRPDNSPDTAPHVGKTFEADSVDRHVQLD